MSYEFTKLSEVPAVSEFPEGANAIIETNGEIKRCPSSGGSSVPKPLTYDYMPEGYPKKTMGTVTLMEEQEVAFTPGEEGGLSTCYPANSFEIVEGQTYTVNWDGTEYECAGAKLSGTVYYIGNLSIAGETPDSGEPFIYVKPSPGGGYFGTFDTAASHTISVITTEEIVTPLAPEFLPDISAGGVTTLRINVTSMDFGTGKPIFTADKTPMEMLRASANGPVWCVISFAAGLMGEEAASFGVPPTWGAGLPTFGTSVRIRHQEDGNNKISDVVTSELPNTWILDLTTFG